MCSYVPYNRACNGNCTVFIYLAGTIHGKKIVCPDDIINLFHDLLFVSFPWKPESRGNEMNSYPVFTGKPGYRVRPGMT